MNAHHTSLRLMFLSTFLFTLFSLAACTGDTATSPRAWIDFPRDGAEIPVGSSVTIISHAYADDGVAEVLLSVNGQAYRRDPPAATGTELTEIRQEWLAEEPGLFTLQVQSFDTAGASGNPYDITVRVIGAVAAAATETVVANTATPTPVLTVTPTMISTISPTPTRLPVETNTPTAVPSTLTATSTIPPALPTFTPTPIPATWTPTLTPPPPTLTPTPSPTLITTTPTATASPSPTPVDTTPPPAPVPQVPADGLVLTCRATQVLAWLPVEDPSGITGYYVRLERQVTTNQWDTVREWGPVSDKQTDAEELQCGLIYRWSVRALDGAGNLGPWSAWSQFSIEFG